MSKNCYLIISPDPSKNRELKILGKAYAKTESSKVEPGEAVQIHSDLHFVKFGDEGSTEERVNKYRTHNPTFWWRTIELGDATGVNGPLGTYLENEWLKDLVRPYGQHAEWHATEVGQAHLEKLCKELDDITDPDNDWLTSQFEDRQAIDDFFSRFFG